MATTITMQEFEKRPQVKSSNKDLSHIIRNTQCCGLVYPLTHMEILPGDKISIDIKSLVQSNALKSPLMGSVNTKYDILFVPYSAYNSDFHTNTAIGGDFEDVALPTFYLDETWHNSNTVFGKSSLLEYLYGPQTWRWLSYYEQELVPTAWKRKVFNAIPLIMYFDALYHLYVNVNEETFPIRNGDRSMLFKWSDLGEDLVKIKNSNGANPINLNTGTKVIGKILEANTGLAQFGLFHHTYGGNRNTRFLSKSNYDKTLSVVITDNMTMQEFYTSQKFYEYYLRLTQGRGRYKEFIQDNYDVTPPIHNNMPTLLGSYQHRLTFDNVLQTAPAQIGSDTSSVGERKGTGVAYNQSGERTFNFKEYGCLMIMATLLPEVDYYQGVHDDAKPKTMIDLFNPTLDGIGMQTLDTDQLFWQPLSADDTGAGTEMLVPQNLSIGYQPAWMQYTSKLNRCLGNFADDLKYWTLALDFRQQGAGATAYSFNPTTYIDPAKFNEPFADIDMNAENFQVQTHFVIRAKRPMANSQMPQL